MKMLDEHNPFVKNLRTAREKLRDHPKENNKDTCHYIWGNSIYTASKFYHLPYKTVNPFPRAIHMDLGVQMCQQNKGFHMVAAHG
jgi:hypothetical protein